MAPTLVFKKPRTLTPKRTLLFSQPDPYGQSQVYLGSRSAMLGLAVSANDTAKFLICHSLTNNHWCAIGKFVRVSPNKRDQPHSMALKVLGHTGGCERRGSAIQIRKTPPIFRTMDPRAWHFCSVVFMIYAALAISSAEQMVRAAAIREHIHRMEVL